MSSNFSARQSSHAAAAASRVPGSEAGGSRAMRGAEHVEFGKTQIAGQAGFSRSAGPNSIEMMVADARLDGRGPFGLGDHQR